MEYNLFNTFLLYLKTGEISVTFLLLKTNLKPIETCHFQSDQIFIGRHFGFVTRPFRSREPDSGFKFLKKSPIVFIHI